MRNFDVCKNCNSFWSLDRMYREANQSNKLVQEESRYWVLTERDRGEECFQCEESLNMSPMIKNEFEQAIIPNDCRYRLEHLVLKDDILR